MKLPNGYGSVYKLSGKRRNPYIARKTTGWSIDEKTGAAKQLYATIGYYPTRAAALQALADYNQNPYDIQTDTITFTEVYEKWAESHFKEIVPSACRTWISAYNHSAPLHDMRFCPTGGISESNAAEFLSQPNVLCIGGSWMLDKGWLDVGDYGRVRETAARAAQIVRYVRG